MDSWQTDGDRRYTSDNQFRQLVDMMYHHIITNKYTPGEMREAAMCASIMAERLNPNPRLIYTGREPSDKIDYPQI